jgi:hypothetical protein
MKTAYHCLNSLDSEAHAEFFQLRNEAIRELNILASSPPVNDQETERRENGQREDDVPSHSSGSMPTDSKIILVSSFVFPSHVITSHDRQVSILLQSALQTNLNNPLIDKIFLINQREYNFSKLSNSHKIQQFILNRRPRYSDLFRLANETIRSTDLVIFTVCDIVFDSSLVYLQKNSLWEKYRKYPPQYDDDDDDGNTRTSIFTLLALTSWSSSLSTDSNLLSLSVQIDKQDVWILRPPIDSQVIMLTDFTLGSRRSDHRLARIFSDARYR